MLAILKSIRVQIALMVCLMSLSAMTSAEPWSTNLKQALAKKNTGSIYSYQLAFKSNALAGTVIVDPTKADGQRTSIISPAASARSVEFNEFAKELEDDAKQSILCSRFAENMPASVTFVSKTAETETYAFTPIPSADMDTLEKKVIASLLGEITISSVNPAVLHFSMRSTKPIKPMFLVRLDTFRMSVKCVRSPDGQTYSQQQLSETTGSALGQSLDDKEEITISNLVSKPR